jgi:hypothetical protein
VVLNALGFGTFVAYVVLTHGYSNACSRLKGGVVPLGGFATPPPAPPLPPLDAAAPAAWLSAQAALHTWVLAPALAILSRAYHAFDLFSSQPGAAEAALGLPVLSPIALGLPGEGGGCTPSDTLAADLRIARGRFLIFVTLCAIILSVVVVKPAQKISDSAHARSVLSALTRADAVTAARGLRASGAKEE